MMLDKVSIIITSYNREDMILDAIKSVENQTYKNIEIIVVDDYSSDNTRKIIDNYIKDKQNIIFEKNTKNMGANYSRNKGIELASGKYISFLDDDDEYLPSKIEEQVSLMFNYDNDIVAYCGFKIYKNNQQIAITTFKYEGDILSSLLEDNFLGNPSLLLLKSMLIEFPFDNNFPSCQDWDLVTRLATRYKFYHTNSHLVKVNKHEGESIGAGPKALTGFEMYYRKHVKKYTFFKFLKVMLLYFVRGIKNQQLFQFKKIKYILKAYIEKK